MPHVDCLVRTTYADEIQYHKVRLADKKRRRVASKAEPEDSQSQSCMPAATLSVDALGCSNESICWGDSKTMQTPIRQAGRDRPADMDISCGKF